jgi:hypothetical protein
VLLEALSADGGSAGSFEVERLYERVIGKVRFHRQVRPVSLFSRVVP